MSKKNQILFGISIAVIAAYFYFKNSQGKKPKLDENEKLALFYSTIRPQRGTAPSNEIIEREDLLIKESIDKIRALGLFEEYSLFLEKYNKEQEGLPNKPMTASRN
jgi:hypothetical protein